MDTWKPSEYWKRVTCIMLIRAGQHNSAIMTAAECSLNTVKTIRREMQSCNGDYEAVAARKQHSRRSDCSRTPEFIQQLQEKVMEDPGKGIRALAREMGVAPGTMKLALNEDLRYHSYRRRKGQLLTEKARERRLKNAKKLLNKVKHPVEPGTMWFFSDEKNFCQDQLHNTQNNRWLAYNPYEVPRVMSTKFPQTVMVFGCVSSEGDVMPPHIFEQGLRLNSHGYVELLNTVVKPWLQGVASGRPFVWQQDSAPCHTAGKTQKWLSENFYDFTSPNVWPPNSPDCNPMDYYVWGVVEKDTNRTASNTKTELIARIKEAFAALPRDTVKAACSRFRSRIEAVVDAQGGFFE